MKQASQRGFSLVELLLVVVIVGIIAALAIPALRKGVRAAENGRTFATMRTIGSSQVAFFQQNNRFGRLPEINNALGRGIGVQIGSDLESHQFLYQMVPASPTDADLRQGFTITATRNVTGDTNIYQYELTQSGEIRQILP